MSDAAIAAIVTGLVTITTLICGVVTLWLKIREGNEKLDHNTDMTRAGALVAAQTAKIAANTAAETKAATQNIERKLNGGVDAAITTALDPVTTKLAEHDAKFESLTQYVHQRNHDILTALQVQTNKMETIIVRLGQLNKEGGAW